MNTAITTYTFNTITVRTAIDDNGEPLFCLSDVCKALDLESVNKTANQIKEEFGLGELNSCNIFDALNRERAATFIAEPQLYFVIMRSRAARAREFRQWICNDVLPAIRKTGTEMKEHNKELGRTEMNDNKLLPDEIVFVDKDQVVTTSRKVAEAFGKRHANVIRDIQNIEKEANSTELKFELSEYQDSTGRKLPEYIMNFDGFILLVMGYTGTKAMQIKLAYIDAFNRMRKELQERTPVLPNFANPAEAARAWAAEYEAKQLALKERDEAVKTKAWISDKKTATAMATASKEKRRADKAEIALAKAQEELGNGKGWQAVSSKERLKQLKKIFNLTAPAKSVIGKELKKLSVSLDEEIKQVQASGTHYQFQNAYTNKVWDRFFEKTSEEPAFLAKYRRV